MSARVVAVLRIKPEGGRGLKFVGLSDALLVQTNVAYSSDVEAMASEVRTEIGSRVEGHDDKRGIFVVPDSVLAILEKLPRTYDGFIEESKVGFWIPVLRLSDDPKIAEVRKQLVDDPVMQERLSALEKLIAEKLSHRE